MDFLHFGLLPWFLPLAAIPIVLHLLTLHRLKTVELSTFRFLFDSYVQQRRRMRFLEALIAMLRTLFLLLLVLAIARPAVRHWQGLFGSGSGRDVVLLVDCSASMDAVTTGVSSLNRAKRAALSIVERLPADDRVTLVRVASKPEEIFSRFSSDIDTIKNQIEGLETRPARTNLFATFAYLFGPGARELAHPRIYLFTDRQTSGFSELRDQEIHRLVPEKSELIVVNVGSSEELPNRAVVGDAPHPHRAIVGLPITLRPRIANHSATETQEVPVSVFVDEKEVARKTLTLKPGETAEAEIIYTPSEPGVLRGRFEIPADRFTEDDSFLFTLTAEPQVKVVLVNGNPAADPFENEGLYLRTALTATTEELAIDDWRLANVSRSPAHQSSPIANQQSSIANRQSSREFVRALAVLEIPESGLTAETLADAKVVILANCGGLTPQQFGWLRDFVSTGGGLIIFPGEKVNLDHYNQQFFPVPGLPDQFLTVAQLTAAEGDPNKAETFERFAALDFAHPVLSVFDDSKARYLTKVSFSRRFGIKLPEKRGNTWPLAEFSSGGPALVESRFGDGRILLAAFPATTGWSNLPLKPEFVPLVLRMVSHVNHRPEVEGPAVVAADGRAEFVVSQSWSPAAGKVADAAGRVTPVVFERSQSRLLGAFERTAEKGYYSVEVNGGRTEQPKQETISFAVNLSPEESNFERIGDDQLQNIFSGVALTLFDASAEAQQLHGSIGEEREVWRPLIYLLFVIIGIEFLLSTMGGRVSAEGDDPDSVADRIRHYSPGRWIGRMTGAEMEAKK